MRAHHFTKLENDFSFSADSEELPDRCFIPVYIFFVVSTLICLQNTRQNCRTIKCVITTTHPLRHWSGFCSHNARSGTEPGNVTRSQPGINPRINPGTCLRSHRRHSGNFLAIFRDQRAVWMGLEILCSENCVWLVGMTFCWSDKGFYVVSRSKILEKSLHIAKSRARWKQCKQSSEKNQGNKANISVTCWPFSMPSSKKIAFFSIWDSKGFVIWEMCSFLQCRLKDYDKWSTRKETPFALLRRLWALWPHWSPDKRLTLISGLISSVFYPTCHLWGGLKTGTHHRRSRYLRGGAIITRWDSVALFNGFLCSRLRIDARPVFLSFFGAKGQCVFMVSFWRDFDNGSEHRSGFGARHGTFPQRGSNQAAAGCPTPLGCKQAVRWGRPHRVF